MVSGQWTFYITDLLGGKIESKTRLQTLERRLLDAAEDGNGADRGLEYFHCHAGSSIGGMLSIFPALCQHNLQ